MKRKLPYYLITASLLLSACQNQTSQEEKSNNNEVTTTTKEATTETTTETTNNKPAVDFENVKAPSNLVQQLQDGGNVIVFRYTGSGGASSPVPDNLIDKVKDDGQRISDESIQMMKQYGEKYESLNIPVNEIFSSEYYFVWQHAQAAFNEPIKITRDLTGSLDFSDTNELNDSLQRLRDRTMTKPPKGKNTVLFTHQGKFDKAYGFYPPAGTTIIFKPDGSQEPHPIAVLSYEEFLNLDK